MDQSHGQAGTHLVVVRATGLLLTAMQGAVERKACTAPETLQCRRPVLPFGDQHTVSMWPLEDPAGRLC